jgi:hypothetical protein
MFISVTSPTFAVARIEQRPQAQSDRLARPENP